MRNIKLVLEYDGTGFHGWQRQRQLRSVQGELEEKLSLLLQEPVRVVGAGRTDAGCHAAGQVANFRTCSDLPPERIMRALNRLLRGEIAVLDACEAPSDFNARYSARSRQYTYLIAQRPTALMRHRVWYVGRPLEVVEMECAARALLGRHDFSPFSRRSQRTERNPYCTVIAAGLRPWELGVAFDIEADRFTHGMVRTIVGTLVRVGLGKLSAECVGEILSGSDGVLPGPTAPARGLCLTAVVY